MLKIYTILLIISYASSMILGILNLISHFVCGSPLVPIFFYTIIISIILIAINLYMSYKKSTNNERI